MTHFIVPRPWSRPLSTRLFPEFDAMQHDLHALCAHAFGRHAPATDTARPWSPRVDAHTKDETLFLRCDLPGVAPEDVELTLTGDVLTIRGERKDASEATERHAFVRETCHGTFERRLQLPTGVNPETVTARHVNGVLEITIPMPATKRRIPVGSDAPAQPDLKNAA